MVSGPAEIAQRIEHYLSCLLAILLSTTPENGNGAECRNPKEEVEGSNPSLGTVGMSTSG